MAQAFLLTGLSGAGKTTLAKGLREALGSGSCVLLDGDELRKGLCKDLGFTPADREENIRRCGEMAKILIDQGLTVILAVIAPYQRLRDNLKEIIGAENLRTIHLSCPLDVCMLRDPKKNYKKVRDGQIKNYTGLGDVYEPPVNPDLTIHTALENQAASLKRLIEFARKNSGK